jgi:hypothetical protein
MARKPTDTVTLSLRIREELRRQLEREAKRQERSLNAEIIHRLEQSFRKSDDAELTADALRAAFGGRTGDFFRAVATAMWLIEKRTGKKWHEDKTSSRGVEETILFILRAFTTPVSPEFVFGWKRLVESQDEYAAEMARKYGEPPPHPELYRAAIAAALEALQKMNMAPSDAEIAEAGARLTKSKPPTSKRQPNEPEDEPK